MQHSAYESADCRELSDQDVRTAIKNSGGVKGSLLIPDAPFELLVRRAITRLLNHCLQCKDFVYGELLRIARQCAPADVERFPALQVSLPPCKVLLECIYSGSSCSLSFDCQGTHR